MNSLKSTLGKFATAAAVAFVVSKLIDFGKQAVETASDLQEVQNVVDTAFGESKQKMEDFADTAVETYGISALTAKQTGSTFMAMASGMGLAQDSASDMAIALTGLSADMSSFYNVEQSVASTALKSIFTGETETLKQFGIVMTDANLQAYALSQGISKSTSEMTQAEKVQLRYNYVMAQTSLAQGDFAKTSDSWANQTRILSEQWKEFAGTIGTVLMNVLLPAVKTINQVLSQLIGIAQSAAQALSEAFGFETGGAQSAAANIASSTAEAADSYGDIAEQAKETEETQENSLASFDKITKLGDSKKSTGETGSVNAITGINQKTTVSADVDTSKADKKLTDFWKSVKKSFASFEKYFDKNFKPIFSGIWDGLKEESGELAGIMGGVFSDIRSLAEPLKSYLTGDFTIYLQTVFRTLGTIITGLFDSFNMVFSDIWNLAVFPILQNFVNVGLPLVTQVATQVWSTLGVLFENVKVIFDTLWSGVVAPILGFIAQLWCDVWQLLSDFWAEWGQPIFDGINEAITTIKDLFLNVWETVLQPIFNNLMNVFDKIWTDHLKPLVAEFLDFVGVLVTGATDIYNKFIAPIANWFIDVLGPIVTKVVNGIANTIGEIVGNIIDAVKGVIKTLKGIIKFITGVFTGDWDKAWNGIKDIFGGIWDTFYSIVKTPINMIIGAINKMTGAIESAINWIIDGINSLSFDVPDWVPGIGGSTFGFDLDHIDIPEIPQLATGTVIPANYGEFLAVLGDNKRETEVVSPLSTIRQAVREANEDKGGSKQPAIIYVMLDGTVVAKSVIDNINDMTNSTGSCPINI